MGFDIDICRAVAAAIFADASRVKFIVLEHIEQFKQKQEIDLVARRLTWTLPREVQANVIFGPIMFYDGQGFLVTRTSGIATAAQLVSAPICVVNRDRQPATLLNYLEDQGRKNPLVLVASDKEAEVALGRNRCQAYSADISWLAGARAGFLNGLARYAILPDTISKEPLAPMMRAEDVEFARLVRWTLFTLIEAEEVGITSHNINALGVHSSRVRRLLAIHPDADVEAGAGQWSRAIIAGVGNYGEVFGRNLGKDSPFRLDRGPNRLWTDGGLIYAPPLN